jgi:hypothetical protein
VIAITAVTREPCQTPSWQVMKMIRLTERTRFGGAFALLLVAASLLFIAGVDWICVVGPGYSQASKLRGFLFLSTGVALCSLLLIFFPGATIQMLCQLLAVYTLSLSVGKFSLARSRSGDKREQLVMYVLAFAALAFSVCLAGFSSHDDRTSLFLLGSYSLFMGLQMLLMMYFLQQQMLRLTGPASRLSQASV